ncbi:HAD-IA family hydrolase [Streptomyces phaeoluteigriseus]|uniref:HAD-IA family hydrolase n=1 Tax=Streptomyces phaeoluteigriseus TaxID=114686 RepID=A0ABY4Z9R3_9ACTN|nr:HAD-IA family hydrolase [Streptomyces phaeoluteigriseus]
MCEFSCQIGHAKPDPGPYAWCVRMLGGQPADVLFVDDREENADAARAVGLRGALFTAVADLRDHRLDAAAPGRGRLTEA